MPLTELSQGLPLFILVDEPTRITDDLTLFVHGTATTGVMGGIDLFLQCESGVGNVATGVLPLSLLGAPTAERTANMNLVVEGGARGEASSSVELTVWNEQTIVESGLPLFIEGSGTTEGTIPVQKGLFLFLQRTPAAALSLYLHDQGVDAASSVPLYVYGAGGLSGTVELSIPEAVGYESAGAKLYTHGF